eukprot:6479243-Amphidinium_carterae.1
MGKSPPLRNVYNGAVDDEIRSNWRPCLLGARQAVRRRAQGGVRIHQRTPSTVGCRRGSSMDVGALSQQGGKGKDGKNRKHGQEANKDKGKDRPQVER